ncbi:hypothetical protein N7471_007227 [Penicillium samsonianum]|uniref:uncharacterized protein n=1 Tax=Penicillium samsonianum TaxID=1882272 RepID=UPI0025471973|nr:uncharacterized protein N7471_007227 [Penicillium samsonianum]KAJ6132012.1 hypothetical protein N7471_007227 [Penicillium samsonianum]
MSQDHSQCRCNTFQTILHTANWAKLWPEERLEASSKPLSDPSSIMDTANFNMGQYRISWCIRGDNTPEYADYLRYLNFWELFREFPKGKTLEVFYKEALS